MKPAQFFRKADVGRYAEAAQIARMAAEGAGMRNVAHLSAEERMKSSVQYRITLDKAADAERDYQTAYRLWREAGYPE